MPLLECPDCRYEISDKAAACPNCGAVLKAPAKRKYVRKAAAKSKPDYWRALIMGIVILGLIGLCFWAWESGKVGEPEHPRPVVLKKEMDDKQSGVLNRRLTVSATILNEGEAGHISVWFYLYQAGKERMKSRVVHLRRNEREEVRATFEGIRLLDGDASYDVKAKPQ